MITAHTKVGFFGSKGVIGLVTPNHMIIPFDTNTAQDINGLENTERLASYISNVIRSYTPTVIEIKDDRLYILFKYMRVNFTVTLMSRAGFEKAFSGMTIEDGYTFMEKKDVI